MQLLTRFIVFNSIIIRLTCLRALNYLNNTTLQRVFKLGLLQFFVAHNRPNISNVYFCKHCFFFVQVSTKKERIVEY